MEGYCWEGQRHRRRRRFKYYINFKVQEVKHVQNDTYVNQCVLHKLHKAWAFLFTYYISLLLDTNIFCVHKRRQTHPTALLNRKAAHGGQST